MKHRLLALSLLLSPCLAGALVSAPTRVVEAAAPEPSEETGVDVGVDVGRVNGVIRDSTTTAPIQGAFVILQCACLDGSREVQTDARGIYQFEALPPGRYQLQVLANVANVSKLFELPRGAKLRANFSIDPSVEEPVWIVIKPNPMHETISMDMPKRLPVERSRRFGTRRPAREAFELRRSLFDDGGLHEITGGPVISFDLN